MIEQFEQMLAQGQDNALLRYSLGSAYFKQGDLNSAIAHLRAAIQHDPGYSAAWKALGKALTAADETGAAGIAYQKGIQIAEEKGDIQAAKEMKVFLKRLQRAR